MKNLAALISLNLIASIAHSQAPGTMWLKQNGSVGFSTSTPLGKVQINHRSSPVNPTFMLMDSATDQGSTMRFANIGVNGFTEVSGLTYEISFRSNSTGIMWLKANGNVGIGTPSPTGKLQVSHRASNESPAIVIFDSTNGNGNGISFRKEAANKQFNMVYDGASLYYNPKEVGVDKSTPWVFTGSGQTGFGTSSPLGLIQLNNKSSKLQPAIVIKDSTSGIGNMIAFRKQGYDKQFRIRNDFGGQDLEFGGQELELFSIDFSRGGVTHEDTWDVSRLAIRGNGNIGIGTTIPQARLQINNKASKLKPGLVLIDSLTGTGNMIAFRKQGSDKQFRLSLGGQELELGGQDLELFSIDYSQGGVTHEDTWNASRFAIRGNGNTGIGTIAPEGRLQVNNKTARFRPALMLVDSSSGEGNMLAMRKQGSNKQFKLIADLGGQDLGLLSWAYEGGGIEDQDDWRNALFTIREDGNIGVSTKEPAGRFQINNKSTNTLPALLLSDSAEGTGNMIAFRKQGVNKQFRINTNLANDNLQSFLSIGVHNDGEVYAPAIALRADGKVGINNPNPVNALDINGDINFSGKLKVQGNQGLAGQVLKSNGPNQSPSWQAISQPSGFNAISNLFIVPAANIIIPGFTVERFDFANQFNMLTGEFVTQEINTYALNAHVAFTTTLSNLPQYSLKVVIEILNADNLPVQALEQSIPLPTNMPAQTIHVSSHSIQQLLPGHKVRLKILHTRPDGPVQAKVEEFSAIKM
ncbi:MAG: hypothetical protein V4717_07450 [Bacteroidota bacterium]